jgi:hypothetical protein
MGCGENKLMAQQVQETVYTIRQEGVELSWVGSDIVQYRHLQKDSFGIGSKFWTSIREKFNIKKDKSNYTFHFVQDFIRWEQVQEEPWRASKTRKG